MGCCVSLPVLSRNRSKKQAVGTIIYEKELSRMETGVTGETNRMNKLEDNVKKVEETTIKEGDTTKNMEGTVTKEEDIGEGLENNKQADKIPKAEGEESQVQQPGSESVFDRLRQSPPTQSDIRASFHGW